MFNAQRPLGFAFGALLFLSAAGSAGAQQQGFVEAPPPFAVPKAPMAHLEPVPVQVPKKPVTSNIYLETTLSLQQQIALLDKLLARERSIAEIVLNYKRMGITYDPPRPELSLCKQVPDNMSCAVAYPEQYAGFLPEPPLPPEITFQPAEVDLNSLPQAVTELSPELAIKELLWTEITCLKSVCRAVITPNIADGGARYAIKVGDVLPPGGVVESISANGIIISSGSTLITLLPAPTKVFGLSAQAGSAT